MNSPALSITITWLFTTFAVVDASAQVVATDTDCTTSNILGMATFSFGPSRLKDFIMIRTNESEPVVMYKSPMTTSNGVWYYTFVNNDPSRQAWRQINSEIARKDFNKVGEISFLGNKFAVTEGPPVLNMNPLPDAGRDEMTHEEARRVELGSGVFVSEKDGLGYFIKKNLTVSTKSTGKIEFGFSF